VVADASALIAFFQDEPGAEAVGRALTAGGLMVSAVNRTEVYGKLIGSGAFNEFELDVEFSYLQGSLEIASFDLEQSNLAAFWYARRNPYNLSLGDCACLALAEAKGVPCLTAERAWAELPNLRVKLELIR
jgi:PIN domain nuclease of toxin-antitoxin system